MGFRVYKNLAMTTTTDMSETFEPRSHVLFKDRNTVSRILNIICYWIQKIYRFMVIKSYIYIYDDIIEFHHRSLLNFEES